MPRKNTPADRDADKAERETSTIYSTEQRPELPTVSGPPEPGVPVISREMIEIRNREAREQAERIARSRRG